MRTVCILFFCILLNVLLLNLVWLSIFDALLVSDGYIVFIRVSVLIQQFTNLYFSFCDNKCCFYLFILCHCHSLILNKLLNFLINNIPINTGTLNLQNIHKIIVPLDNLIYLLQINISTGLGQRHINSVLTIVCKFKKKIIAIVDLTQCLSVFKYVSVMLRSICHTRHLCNVKSFYGFKCNCIFSRMSCSIKFSKRRHQQSGIQM